MNHPWLFIAGLFLAAALPAQIPGPLPPTNVPGLAYTNAFFPGADPDPAIPSPAALLSFELGQQAVTAAEIERCLKAWTNVAGNRARLVEYARSQEGRPLHYLIVTSPRHLSRLAEIQAGLARLGDPRDLSEAESVRLTESLP